MAIRLCLVPVAWAQVRAEHHRRQLAPEVRALTQKYRNNPERLRRELAALYAKAGTSPLAGCLPALAQAPVFTVLYGLLITADVGGEANTLTTYSLASVPLDARLTGVSDLAQLLVFVVLMLLLGAVAWATRRQAAAVAGAAPTADTPGGAHLATFLRLLPFGTVIVAAVVPLAAGLYLLTSTSWTVVERAILRRRVARQARPRGTS
jgi:YidC/Oxa1 family membrane protein insertase